MNLLNYYYDSEMDSMAHNVMNLRMDVISNSLLKILETNGFEALVCRGRQNQF